MDNQYFEKLEEDVNRLMYDSVDAWFLTDAHISFFALRSPEDFVKVREYFSSEGLGNCVCDLEEPESYPCRYIVVSEWNGSAYSVSDDYFDWARHVIDTLDYTSIESVLKGE